MGKENKLKKVYYLSLIIVGVLTCILGMINIMGIEINHTIRMIISIFQIMAGVVVLLLIKVVYKSKTIK